MDRDESLISVEGDPFPGRAESIMAFQFLKASGCKGEIKKLNFVSFVVWRALIAGGWVGGGGMERKVLLRAG